MRTIPATVFMLCFLSACGYTSAQTAWQVQSAISFTKLYGYVRYFHPSDEAAALDWDRFAVYGSKQVLACKNDTELQRTLAALFAPIAPTVKVFSEKQKINFNKSALTPAAMSGYQTIAWQHQGVDLGNEQSAYQSARTNRPLVDKKSRQDYAPLSIFQEGGPVQGKAFLFQCRVRRVSGDGKGQLWVRVDRSNKTMGFFENMDARPVVSESWQNYEIRGTVDADAAAFYFGVMAVGKTAIEFDDLKMQVKEGDAWKDIFMEDFTQDEHNAPPKKLFFNPQVGEDYAITVKKSGNGEAVLSVSSKDKLLNQKMHDPLFARYPAVGEYIEKRIGSGLKIILPLALYGNEKSTFPAADAASYKRLNDAIKDMPEGTFSGDSLALRLGNLAMAWNVFEHFYPYFDVAHSDWNEALKHAVEQAFSDQNAGRYLLTLKQLTAHLKDGHIQVGWSGNRAIFQPTIGWEWIEQELVITHVGDSAIPLKRGDLVKTIDGVPSAQHFDSIHRQVSAATKGWMAYRAQTESMLGSKDSYMTLNVARGGNAPFGVRVKRTVNQMQYRVPPPQTDTIKLLANDMYYINLASATMQAIGEALASLKKSRVIICDLRGYPRANHGFISFLLTQKDTSKRWMQVAQLIYPDQKGITGWKNFSWELEPAQPHLNAKMIFLIDGRAISYAESYMSFIEHYKLGTIIGQPTAGTNGNVNPIFLPGGYSISWTGMKVEKHDGSRHHGVGILPNIYVEKTIRGVREGRDEFLEKALEVAKGL